MTDRAPRLHGCYAVPLRGGRWGACQVLGLSDGQADVVAFDWVGEEPPTLEQLAKAKALVLSHHAHRERVQRCYYSGLVPPDFRALGERPPLLSGEMQPPSYGSWAGVGHQLLLQWRWDHEVPRAELERYRAGDREITLGETTALPSYTTTIGAARWADFPWPASEPVPWRALDAAGTLTKLTYHGRDVGVISYVASRKLVTELNWYEHGQSSLDFRGASLLELRLDVPRRLAVSVDAELRELTLSGHGKGRSVAVEHPAAGQELQLHLWQPLGGVVPPAVKGLERLSELDLGPMKQVDLRAIAKAYPKLKRLTLRGKYAKLEHLEALTRLRELESATFYDVYDLDVASLPPIGELPRLSQVTFGGLRKSDAQLLRKHFATLEHLDVHGAKNDAWIAANANNPLRDWVDDDEAFGEQACKIFAKAYRAATKAGAEKGAKKGKAAAEAKQALTDFVKALNKLAAKFELADTVRREEAYEAYHQLVALTGVSSKLADAWWGELCDF